MAGFSIAAIYAIKILSRIYDVVTFPIYLILHKPWERLRLSRRIKAKVIYKDDSAIVFRNLDNPGPLHISLEKQKIETLEGMLKWTASRYGNKKCLGTRQILAEEDEVQSNGSVHQKVLFQYNPRNVTYKANL